MLLKTLCIAAVAVIAAAVFWLIHGALLLPIRSGSCESITITVSAFGEAPEREMQLRGLLWLRSHGLIPCRICIEDTGLSAEFAAVARCFAAEYGIIVSDKRGTDIHG